MFEVKKLINDGEMLLHIGKNLSEVRHYQTSVRSGETWQECNLKKTFTLV